MEFQSHAGSIEAFKKETVDLGYPLFQSHAGSIEADFARPPRAGHFPFQSHAGSIEAVASSKETLRSEGSFNPTLVRLRRWLASRSGGPAIRFQSHAGSIEASPWRACWWDWRCKVSIPRWFD